MNKITYQLCGDGTEAVYLEGLRVGSIKPTATGNFRYFPKGSRTGGDELPTRQAVRRSIEAE